MDNDCVTDIAQVKISACGVCGTVRQSGSLLMSEPAILRGFEGLALPQG